MQEITASGFRVEPHRIVTETISGSVAISQRPEFARLADRLESGDVLVVSKLDRLGRNAMDVAATVAGLIASSRTGPRLGFPPDLGQVGQRPLIWRHERHADDALAASSTLVESDTV